MLEYGMNPQEALDAPRFCIQRATGCAGAVDIEEGIPLETLSKLRSMGHRLEGPVTGHQRAVFGRGQIIRLQPVKGDDRDETMRVWWAGSDGRADGMAVGY